MPNNVAGRKARCNSCGFIFSVPLSELNPEPARGIPLEPESVPGLQKEQVAAEPAPRAVAVPVEKSDAGLLDFADTDDILAPAVVLPSRPPELAQGHVLDEDRGAVIAPTKPYLQELAESFLFFLDGGSFVTFLIIVLINIWTVPLLFAGPIGMLGLLLMGGYLCTFYMSVIKETAGGEDELPNLWPTNVMDDIALGSLRFLGTCVWVLLPAIGYACVEYINFNQISWHVVTTLAVIGLVFWPVVILGVSIGGGFYGLWPHTIIRTAAAAPLAYLAMCVVLLLAAGLNAVPHADLYQNALQKLSTKTGRSLFWLVVVINAGLNAYTMIVAMHAIGLYYRHYKRRFPWVAE